MKPHTSHRGWLMLGLALIVAATGCATAYHAYSDSCIPYRYCAPPPLPFVPYARCHCPTPAAEREVKLPSPGTMIASPDNRVDAGTP